MTVGRDLVKEGAVISCPRSGKRRKSGRGNGRSSGWRKLVLEKAGGGEVCAGERPRKIALFKGRRTFHECHEKGRMSGRGEAKGESTPEGNFSLPRIRACGRGGHDESLGAKASVEKKNSLSANNKRGSYKPS